MGAFLRVAKSPACSPDTDAFWALREMLRLAKAAHASIALPEAEDQWPHLLALAQKRRCPCSSRRPCCAAFPMTA